MATTTVARPELFTQIEVGKILKLDRRTVGEIAPLLGCDWKRAPNRPGMPRFLDRSDVSRFARRLGIKPDWSALSA
jgi:hypothetical protein